MGWCHAFGPQIKEGCSHPMVAGHDSCSCTQCGAVCPGLFAGCASVWAAGPRKVAVSRPSKDGGSMLPVPVAVPVASPAPGGTAPREPAPAESVAADHPDLRALRVDMQLLMWKVDQLHQATKPGERMVQAAREIGAVAAVLPEQLKEAVSAALEVQRRATIKMFSEMEHKIVADIGDLRHEFRHLRGAPAKAASAADLDARFQWLVEAVSERFVTLGNELARIERQIDDIRPTEANSHGIGTNGATSNGASNGATPHGNGRAPTTGVDDRQGAPTSQIMPGDPARP